MKRLDEIHAQIAAMRDDPRSNQAEYDLLYAEKRALLIEPVRVAQQEREARQLQARPPAPTKEVMPPDPTGMHAPVRNWRTMLQGCP